MLILAALGLLSLFYRVKDFRRPYRYFAFVLTLYRDFTFVVLLLIYLLEKAVDTVTYSLLIIPIFVTPPVIFAAQELIVILARRREPGSLSSVEEAEGHVYLLLSTAAKILSYRDDMASNITDKQNSNVNQCYLLSALNLHARHCESSDCICKEITGRQMLKKRKQIYRNDWLQFVKTELNSALQKHSKEPRLLLLSACLEYYYFSNFFLALAALRKAEALKPPLTEVVSFHFVRREIELTMMTSRLPFLENASGRQGSLNVRRLTKSMKLYNRFLERVEDYLMSNVSFWNLLLTEVPNTQRLNYLGLEIFERMNQINELHNKMVENDPSNVDFLEKYGLFLKNVMFDEIGAEKVFERVRILIEKNELHKIFHSKFGKKMSKLIMMRVSGRLNSLGKILDANLVALERLKYERNELLRLSANQLLPSVLSEVHDKWIMAAYEKLIDPWENSLLHGFIKDKEGYFILCSFLLRLIPNLKDEINFLVIVQLNRKFTGYIQPNEQNRGNLKALCLFICDENDRIIGINKAAGDWIQTSPMEISGKLEITMQNLIPELGNSEIEGQLTSNNGYTCSVNQSYIANQLEESFSKCQEEAKDKTVSTVWVRLVKETYGDKVGIPVYLKVYAVVPILPAETGTLPLYLDPVKKDATVTDDTHSNKEEAKKKTEHNMDDNSSMGHSSSTSSVSSRTNIISEFKASLYECTTPWTIRVLKYTFWLLYCILLASSCTDWIAFYLKTNDSLEQVDITYMMTVRLNSLAIVMLDARTIDFVTKGVGGNRFYGDNFYNMTHSQVIPIARHSL